jgi:hypothetical protein
LVELITLGLVDLEMKLEQDHHASSASAAVVATTRSVRTRRWFTARFRSLGVMASLTVAVGCSDDTGNGSQNTSGAGAVAGTSSMSGAAGNAAGGSAATASGGSGTSGNTSSGGNSAAGSAGSGGALPAPVKPVMRDGKWALDMGEATLEVDASVGARIVTFKLGAENLLTGSTVNPMYYGSTLWISPQAQWEQAAHIDSEPYTAQATDSAVVLSVAADDMQGVSATKTFSADPVRGSFIIEYKLTNGKQAPVLLAPWEVTRVFPRGLTFYPTGTYKKLSEGATMPTTDSGGLTWYAYDMNAVTNDSKIFADGAEGWLAHVASGIVFIKKFPDVSPGQIAPEEGDVELYTNLAHSYVELENQGAYASLEPNQSVAWKVEWFLRRLPAGIEATAGNMALAQFVRETIK